jgi:hypothetical protein
MNQISIKNLDEIFDLETQLQIESTSDERLDQNFDDFDEEVIETSIPGVILDQFEEGTVAVQGENQENVKNKKTKSSEEKSTKKSVNLFDKMESKSNKWIFKHFSV